MQRELYPHRPLMQHINRTQRPTTSPPVVSRAPPGLSVEEWQQVLKATQWDGPESQVKFVENSTSPKKSTFTIQDFKQSYSVGDELLVTIFAKDFTGQPKRYGGDFFQAKVHSDTLKASVFGEIIDHQNGTYSARFILPWAGQASVAVILLHSSEAILALKQHWNTDTDNVHFTGYFEGNNSKGPQVHETALCTIKWPGVLPAGIHGTAQKNCCCEYPDARTGLIWECRCPRTLPCDTLKYHSTYRDYNYFTDLEMKLMTGSHCVWLHGDSRLIKITSAHASVGARNPCKPGLPTPIPAGFYFNDVWTSFVCATRQFEKKSSAACLKQKHIHIVGDSTSRQWFEYLLKTIPSLWFWDNFKKARRPKREAETLKLREVESVFEVGPHLAVDVQNMIDLHWRTHGLPYRCVPKVKMTAFQYIENVIDDMAGGPETVLVISMLAHYTQFPLSYFAHRVLEVRRVVSSLLRREPQTKVIIKTANTASRVMFHSNWPFFQFDRVLRETFRDMNVFILDVWQMTSCHYLRYDIHPKEVIIRNEIDMLLSFICPK